MKRRTLFAFATALVLCGSAVSVALAEEEETDQPTADLNVSFFSQYIWRGL